MTTRRALIAAGGVAAAGASLLASSEPGAALAPALASNPLTTPPVAGVHLQFGADASSEMVVSWHTLQRISHPRVAVGRIQGKVEQTVVARETSYTDAKVAQAVDVKE